MAKKDFYEVLGVARDVDGDTLKKAYRKLAMQFHPDKNPGDQEAEERFKECAEAYDVLSDGDKRAKYDRFGHAAFQGGGGGGFHSAEDIFQNFGDIFSDFFGMGSQQRRQSTRGPRRGSDLRFLTEVQLKDVIEGLEKDIEFEADQSCEECHGTGAEKGTKPETCKTCQGQGQVVRQQGFFTMATACPTCHGTGQTIKTKCKACKGQGRTEKKHKIRINIPAGVDTGTRLRIGGEGEGGYLGGPPGDLYVEIRVKPHPNFERQGSDLFADLAVPYVQMMLGAEIEVPTVTGTEKVQVPRGSQPEEMVKLAGQGLPSLKGSRRGDIYYRIEVQLPESPTKEEEKLLREIAQLHGLPVNSATGLFGKKKS